jgi:hypothetical protein
MHCMRADHSPTAVHLPHRAFHICDGGSLRRIQRDIADDRGELGLKGSMQLLQSHGWSVHIAQGIIQCCASKV